MKLHNLPKTTTKPKKRLGRGYGSGKGGHTVGRGQKGQKSRSKVGLLFEGTKFRKSLVKRLPLLRGKGKLKPRENPIIVNIKYLNLLPTGSLINVETLAKNKIVDLKEAREFGIKILGEGQIGVALKMALPCSKGAEEKIKKAGGEVIKLKISREAGSRSAGKNEKLKIKGKEKKRTKKPQSPKGTKKNESK